MNAAVRRHVTVAGKVVACLLGMTLVSLITFSHYHSAGKIGSSETGIPLQPVPASEAGKESRQSQDAPVRKMEHGGHPPGVEGDGASRLVHRSSVLPGNPLNNGMQNLPGARVLEMKDIPSDRENIAEQARLVSADLKYPLIRVEETVQIDPATRRKKVLTSRAMAADHIIVKLQDGIPEARLLELNGRNNALVRAKMSADNSYLVTFVDATIDTVPEAIAAYMRERDIVRYAEPDFLVYADQVIPNDPRFNELWGMHNTGQAGGTVDADIDAPEAWQTTVGNSIVVAVIDTGVDYLHEDLSANMWTNPGEIPANGIDDDGNGYVDDVHGMDAYNSDSDPADDHGHGTHLSGTIAGAGNNGIGVAGVCWQALIMALKFLSGGETGYTSDAIECIDYAAKMGARVMNNSWGGGGYSHALFDAIERANASNALFCAAAGNSAENNDASPHYPSSYTNANVLAVAASTRTDSLSSFSCYGAASVDLAAPGSSILSTLPENQYASWSGTSMATPHCSGAAALLLSQNNNMTPAQLKLLLMENTDPVAAFSGMMVSGGRLNVSKALQHVYGICFDKPFYFSDSWALITMADPGFAGDASHDILLSSSDGDSETLTLYPQQAGSSVFTNMIFIAYGMAASSNGTLEGVHGTVVSASYTGPAGGYTNSGEAVVLLGLTVSITTPPTAVPFSTTNYSVTGVNNGNVLVCLVVSNEATGDSRTFVSTNSWTTPAVSLATNQGVNIIHVFGTNIYGFEGSDSVAITRFAPAGTNYVSKSGSHTWPYSSWAAAATRISAAVGAAATSNLVLVANGTYDTELVEIDRPMALRSVNGHSVTTIDGLNSRGCVSVTADAVIEGFTLTRGKADYGGGAYISAGEIRNCLISSNAATYYGGGVYFEDGGLAAGCTITGNVAYFGGAIEFDGGGTAVNCELAANKAWDSGGGADFWSGGTLSNCVIRNNVSGGWGGGVECVEGGLVVNCTVTGNHADYDGGGIESYYTGGIVRNSAIIGNTAGRYGGGMDMWRGGDLDNCTVVNNSAVIGGGIYCEYGGRVRNSIIYHNTAPSGANYSISGIGETFETSCILPDPGGAGNITSDPFLSGLLDPHLMPGSPCVDAGNNAYAAGNDIDGLARIENGTVDIGCDEFTAGGATGLLAVAINAESTDIAPGYVTRFVGMITGRPSSFTWDFGTGTILTNNSAPTHSWAVPGSYPVVLTAYNDDYPAGVSDTVTVHVSSAARYVSPAGGHVKPFDSWAKAANDIQSAIDVCPHGGTVIVTNGLYETGGYVQGTLTTRAGLYKPVAVMSVNGPSNTFIVGKGPMGSAAVRCAYLVPDASLIGFTLTNGCTTTSGSTMHELYGGGAFLDGGGVLSNCVMAANQAYFRGGGIFFLSGGSAFNCLIYSNYSGYYGGGAYFYEGGNLGHCTVAANSSMYYGGGLYCYEGGDIRNSIIYYNDAPFYPNNKIYGSGAKFEYTCTTSANDLPGGTGCISAAPMFTSTNLADYHLLAGSPCIDTGLNGTGIDDDLDGLVRPLDGDTNGTSVADMGAYEYLPDTLDTDGDEMPDAWEIAHGLDRLVDDSAVDLDGDGLTNLQEYLNSTDPHRFDTDGDKYGDSVEISSGSNPLDPASRPVISVTITGPTTAASFSTTNTTVNLSGTLSSVAAVTSMVISNNRHIASDSCAVASNWNFSGMPLYSGVNVIKVMAPDVAGNALSDTITITRIGDTVYRDMLFSGVVVQEIDFPDNLVPGDTVAVRWKTLSYIPLRARLGTGSKTDGWYIYKNAQYTGSAASPWNLGGRNASVYSYQCSYVVPTNRGDFSIWFNFAQMDGGTYMAAVVPDGADTRPDLTQSKLISRTIVAGGTNANPQSDAGITDTENPFESTQEALMRSGGTIIGISIPSNDCVAGNTVTCRWTVLSYVPVYSKLSLVNLAQQKIWLQAAGTQTGSSPSTWHIGNTYAKEYTFQAVFTVPDCAGTQQIYFLNCQRGVANSSWMAANIQAGKDPRPVLYNGMYGRFIERDIAP